MWTARSQAWTCRASASASEYTATVRRPMRRAVAAMRQAISPRLAIRSVSNTGVSLHSEHAKARVFDGCVARRGQAQPEHATRVGGLDDAVVPQARGGVVGMALVLVLVADGRLEGFLVLGAPLAALALDALAAHRGQHAGGLFAAHDRNPGIGPQEQQPGAE